MDIKENPDNPKVKGLSIRTRSPARAVMTAVPGRGAQTVTHVRARPPWRGTYRWVGLRLFEAGLTSGAPEQEREFGALLAGGCVQVHAEFLADARDAGLQAAVVEVGRARGLT